MKDGTRELRIRVDLEGEPRRDVSALLAAPDGARACLVLAHGAGAGMTHPFMEDVARGLSARGFACLRYQFPFMEAGSRRPDRPAAASATVRAAIAAAADALPGMPVFAGGKSFGGRMTSTAQAATPLPRVRGLLFLGFPLHPAGKPGTERARHLAEVRAPMLFVQGTREALADLALLRPVIAALGSHATLLEVQGADHSFHVPRPRRRASGEATVPVTQGQQDWQGSDADVLAGILDEVVAWMDAVTGMERARR